jgi:outer membrane protein assembly factor BamD
MNRWIVRLFLLGFCLAALPQRTPAPLIYRPGEGWSYEPIGGGKWVRNRAKDQLEVAQRAYDEKDYSIALKAARRTVRVWPFSDYAPQGQYLLAQSYEAKQQDERAFNEYQKLLEKYPKIPNYDEVLQRQYEIANRYLAGQWFKLWNVIPAFPSMEKTSGMYEKVIRNGPYSEVAAHAQMNIGAAREKQENFPMAVKAYEHAADRYHFHKDVAADAHYKAGLAYTKQAKTAEYDQSIAGKAIDTFSEFVTLYPNDPRVAEAQKTIESLRTEQARGSFGIAEFYEKKNRLDGALIYYNEVLLNEPNSVYAERAKLRIDRIKKRLSEQTPAAEPAPKSISPS